MNGCEIQVNTWIPSAPSPLVRPGRGTESGQAGSRWARRMQKKFGTAYLHGSARDATPDYWMESAFYRDIGRRLRMEAQEPRRPGGAGPGLEETAEARRRLGQARAVSSAAASSESFELKSYVRDYGLSMVSHLCVIPDPGEP